MNIDYMQSPGRVRAIYGPVVGFREAQLAMTVRNGFALAGRAGDKSAPSTASFCSSDNCLDVNITWAQFVLRRDPRLGKPTFFISFQGETPGQMQNLGRVSPMAELPLRPAIEVRDPSHFAWLMSFLPWQADELCRRYDAILLPPDTDLTYVELMHSRTADTARIDMNGNALPAAPSRRFLVIGGCSPA